MKKEKQTAEGIAALTKVCITGRGKIMLSAMRTQEQVEQSVLQNTMRLDFYTRNQLPLQVSRQSFQILGLAEVYFSATDPILKRNSYIITENKQQVF